MSHATMQASVFPKLPKKVCTTDRLDILRRAGFGFTTDNESLFFWVDGILIDTDDDDKHIPWREALQAMRDEADEAELIIEGAYVCDKFLEKGGNGGFVFYFTKYGVQEANTQTLLERFLAENRQKVEDGEASAKRAARAMACSLMALRL